MNYSIRRILILFAVIAVSAVTHLAQMKSPGQVVELLDGKTVVVAIPTGRVTVELQYIDVPEPAQALHAVVKDHVRRMLVGQSVELRTTSFTRGKAAGKIILGDVDVSQQLLRDGAAWHVPIRLSGQAQIEFDEYASSEALARQEKRGVWSIHGLKTPWEVRAEDEKARAEAEIERRRKNPVPVGVSQYRTDTRGSGPARPSSSPELSRRTQMDAWVGTLAHSRNESYGLQTYNDPNGRYTVVYSSPIVIDFASPAGKEKLECRVIYVTARRYDGAHEGRHYIGFRAITDSYRFSRRTRLTALVDKKPLSFIASTGMKGSGLIGGNGTAAEEIIMFESGKASLRSIAKAKTVTFRINNMSGTLPIAGADLIRQVAEL